MKNLIRVELLKLRTTPALYICAAVVGGLTIVSVIANVLLAGKNGGPPLGSVENVNKVFSVAALSTMVAMAIGIVTVAGEYRYRTIMTAYLAEPRRGRVAVAKLATAGALGAVTGALAFGLAVAVAVPMFAAKGVHHLPVDIASDVVGRDIGEPAASACSASPWEPRPGTRSVRSSAQSSGCRSSRSSVLQPSIPSLAKWLPTGAGVALTSSGHDAAELLSPGPAAVVLLAWAGVLTFVAAKVSLSREVS